jgi:hypothetical protein
MRRGGEVLHEMRSVEVSDFLALEAEDLGVQSHFKVLSAFFSRVKQMVKDCPAGTSFWSTRWYFKVKIKIQPES